MINAALNPAVKLFSRLDAIKSAVGVATKAIPRFLGKAPITPKDLQHMSSAAVNFTKRTPNPRRRDFFRGIAQIAIA